MYCCLMTRQNSPGTLCKSAETMRIKNAKSDPPACPHTVCISSVYKVVIQSVHSKVGTSFPGNHFNDLFRVHVSATAALWWLYPIASHWQTPLLCASHSSVGRLPSPSYTQDSSLLIKYTPGDYHWQLFMRALLPRLGPGQRARVSCLFTRAFSVPYVAWQRRWSVGITVLVCTIEPGNCNVIKMLIWPKLIWLHRALGWLQNVQGEDAKSGSGYLSMLSPSLIYWRKKIPWKNMVNY